MRKKKKKNRPIIVFLTLILIICIAYVIAYIINSRKNINTNQHILEEIKIDEKQITENKTERILQIEELKKENNDIIAWIEIEGTNINYPVLQTDNNDYYINHNYKKEKNSTGALFLDKDFDFKKTSTNYLIYGHRNKQGLMFEDLLKYSKQEFYNSHKTIKFTTLNEEAIYEILAVFYSRVYYKDETDVFRYYYFVDAKNEQEYNEFVDNAKKSSIYDTKVTAKYGEQLLTLSTCEYSQEDGRFVVVAKKI